MRNYILLFVNGQQHSVTGSDALITLSDFLRHRLKLCGTKIVCSEGDCGSCSVLCGRQDKDTIQYSPIDSCIGFVFQFDGCHIVTVEGLNGCNETTGCKNKNAGKDQNSKSCGDKLNGVQQAMIDCHGSQCGFCTPGFVVAMTGVLEQNNAPSEDDWRHALTGNLCRCTGYSPIIEAGLKSDTANTPPIRSVYPDETFLRSANTSAEEAIEIQSDSGTTLYCPTTIAAAVEFLDLHPDARIVAGATDVGVRFNKGERDFQNWLSLSRIREMEGAEVVSGENGNSINAGARATWTEIENLVRHRVPQFHSIVSIFGSPQIRNMGTIGGNIINASPIADSIPFLLVCEAEFELTGKSGTRTVNVNSFYQDYKKFDLRSGELLTRIRIPLPSKNSNLRLYKVSRRRDLDISTFTAAVQIEADDTEKITRAAIAFGAVGPVVLRLPETEAFLVGKTLSLETMIAAGEISAGEITPISDVRGGEDFRYTLARNILLKYFHETQAQTVGVEA